MAIAVFLPQGDFTELIPQQELPASKGIMALVNFGIGLIIYGLLGFIGLKLAKKIGFADIWDKQVTNKQRFLVPAIVGCGIGIIFILGDIIFYKINTIGTFLHPSFPLSLIASATAGIGEEIIFRLFFISFWVWLISFIILKKKFQNQIFWITAVISALGFALGHLPSLMLVFGFASITAIPIILIVEILILNGVVALPAAYYFRKYGFLAAVGIHFWVDIVWHVIYGLF